LSFHSSLAAFVSSIELLLGRVSAHSLNHVDLLLHFLILDRLSVNVFPLLGVLRHA
jgi:hypothetical protein